MEMSLLPPQDLFRARESNRQYFSVFSALCLQLHGGSQTAASLPYDTDSM